MKLKNIDEITEDGLTVFMPSGIQAVVKASGDEILVNYYNLTSDKYTKDDFKDIIAEGIEVFYEPAVKPIMENADELKLKDFLGINIMDFNSRKELCEYIDKNTTYKVQSADDYTLYLVDPSSDDDQIIEVGLEHKLTEAFNQEDCEPGSVYTALKNDDPEYVTAEYKEQLLLGLDTIAREYPNVKVRQQAISLMDDLGLQEYHNIKEIKEFINKYNKILKATVTEELDKSLITVYGAPVDLKTEEHKWLDDDTFVLTLSKDIDGNELEHDGVYVLECEYWKDENKFKYVLVFEDDSIDATKVNYILSSDDKLIIKEYMQKLIKEDLNEAAAIKGTSGIENIIDSLAKGDKEGYDPIEFGNWICNTSLDNKWGSLSDNMQTVILDNIGAQVEYGDLEYTDLEISFNYAECLDNNLDETDLESLGVFDEDEIIDMMNHDYKVITTLISYNIETDGKIQDEKNETLGEKSKMNKKKLKEEYGEYQGSLDQVADCLEDGIYSGTSYLDDGREFDWNLTIDGKTIGDVAATMTVRDWLLSEISHPVKDGHDYYNGLDLIIFGGSLEKEDWEDEDVIKDLISLGFDEDYLHDIQKEVKEDAEFHTEAEAFIDYDINMEVEEIEYVIVDNEDKELSDRFDDKEYADDQLDSYRVSNDNDPDYVDEEDFVDEPKYFVVDGDGDQISPSFDTEDEAQDYLNGLTIKEIIVESFKLKKKKSNKKKLDEKNIKTQKEDTKNMNENVFKVYNSIEDKECGEFGSWDEVEAFLNQEWGTYTNDAAKLNAENKLTDEDKENFFGGYDVAIIEVHVEPEETATDEDVHVAVVTAEPEKSETPDQTLQHTQAETEVLNPIEDGENVLLANEQSDNEAVNATDETETEKREVTDLSSDKEQVVSDETSSESNDSKICPDCGEKLCVCVPAILEAFEDEDLEYEFRTVRKNALANPSLYGGKYAQKDIRVARKEFMDDREAKKNEAFQDNMGMLTDINDLDFPDALQKAVDTKEDGSLYRIADIAKEVADLKVSVKTEIDSIKDELKTALAELKQGIKDDVKDIQIDVTSKLDNTDAKIADLTSEEEDLEDEDVESENTAEEQPEETEEEQVSEAMVQALKKLPVYKQAKEVIQESKLPGHKISLGTLCTKLSEDYGVNCKITSILDNIAAICEHTDLKVYMIDGDEEQAMQKDKLLSPAKRFLKGGIMDGLAKVKQQENLDDAKRQIDRLATQGEAGKKKIKGAIDMTTDNQEDAEAAMDYAVDTCSESTDLKSRLLKTSSTAAFGSIMGSTAELTVINAPTKM